VILERPRSPFTRPASIDHGPGLILQCPVYRDRAAVDHAVDPLGSVGVVALAPDDDRGPLRGLSPGALPYHIRELSPLFTLRIVEARGL